MLQQIKQKSDVNEAKRKILNLDEAKLKIKAKIGRYHIHKNSAYFNFTYIFDVANVEHYKGTLNFWSLSDFPLRFRIYMFRVIVILPIISNGRYGLCDSTLKIGGWVCPAQINVVPISKLFITKCR